MSERFGTIVRIGDILVSEEVFTEFFACDYPVCKGVCCIIGDSGAPLKEEELEGIEAGYDRFSSLMTDAGRETVRKKGFFEIDREGDIVTPVVEEVLRAEGDEGRTSREFGFSGTVPKKKFPQSQGPEGKEEPCAFCHFAEDGACLCAMEMAGVRKPDSCRLYPIRVVQLGDGMIGLNLHRWHICKSAFEKGRREGIRVFEFLKGPLTDIYGPDFYEALTAAAAHVNKG